MRGVQVRSDQRWITCCMAAAIQELPFAQVRKLEHAQGRNVWWAASPALAAQPAMIPGELPHEEVLQKQAFGCTAPWADNPRSRLTTGCPNFIHENSKVPPGLTNCQKPVSVGSHQLAVMDADSKPTEIHTESTTARGSGACTAAEGHLEVAICKKLCDDGLLSDAVNALSQLVQRGCNVPSNLFYRVLKRCILNKDLALGRRIHALSIKGGLEENSFLATHFIGLYSSHGRLEEAKAVFAKVPTPDAYNWAALIFAYSRNGGGAEAAEAIQLYRRMCETSTIYPDDRLFSAVLKACTAAKDLIAGKEVHARIVASSRKPDRFVQAGLVHMYAKCGSLDDARRLFNTLTSKDVVTWTSMIAGYVQQTMGQEAVTLYRSMKQKGVVAPNSLTYACLLQACGCIGVGALHQGKELHLEIKERGLDKDVALATNLVHMYAKCGGLEDARTLFERLPKKDVVTWTLMIAAHARRGMCREALHLYRSMKQDGLTPPNSVTYVCLLQACASLGVEALSAGKQLHAEVEERGLHKDMVLGGSLINMYIKCGSLEDARGLFDKLSDTDVVAWTSLIAGYVQNGMGEEALSLYSSMQQKGLSPDSVAYICLLQACSSIGVGALHEGKQLHAQIKERGLEDDLVLGGSLANMYVKCGSLEDARRLFDELPHRNVLAWNALISGYAQQGMGQEALGLYKSMQEDGLTPNTVTYVCLLQACASVGVGALHEGKQLHAQIEERNLDEDAVLGGSLVNMYAKCGCLEDAFRLFDKLPDRNVVAWNAMIAGYAQQGMSHEAFSLYNRMKQEGLTPDCVTYVGLLKACADVGVRALRDGKQLHSQIQGQGLEEDVVLRGSLVNMYAKCGSLEDARRLADKLPETSIEAWTSMIAGYAQQGMGQEALELYGRLRQKGLTPDSVTYICLLQACAAVAALPLGKLLHAEIEEVGMQADNSVGAALVNMYAKCGSICESQQVFDSLSQRSIDAWTALVSGYAREGDSQVVFDLLSRMSQEGVRPNEITFLSVMTVCSHVGLVDKGREYFEAMRANPRMTATIEHYICMVDILGRAGLLQEALEMAQNMPFPPNEVVWHTLLGACEKWKNVEIGLQAFKGAISLDEKDAAAYVLMSNIYASNQIWEAANQMKSKRLKFGAWKKPGKSWWTDVGGAVHTFLVGEEKSTEGIQTSRRGYCTSYRPQT